MLMPRGPRDLVGGASLHDIQHAWHHAPEDEDGDIEERRRGVILGAQVGTRHWDRVLREKWITMFYIKGSEIWLPMA